MSETLFGKYRLLAELGRGGMADVYLAASNGLGGFQKLVVIKVSRVSDDPAFSQMFLDEARLSARLSHSNVVQTYEVGEENGRQFIIMEYLDGTSLYRLNRLTAGAGGVPLRVVVQILANILAGLEYAHTLTDFDGTSLNVVHRDLSPQNVMITAQGVCKLLDFGIAKTSESRTLTHAGFYRGKLNYMAPEQALGNPVDARADVFAVGVLLAEAIIRKPFWGEATSAIISARLFNGDIPRIEEAKIDPVLEEICAGALVANRDQRIGTAQEFRESLEWYLSTTGGPVTTEQLAVYLSPIIAPDRQKVNALIDQQLKQGTPVGSLSLPQVGKVGPLSAYATVTGAPARPFVSRGSGYTPVVPGAAPDFPVEADGPDITEVQPPHTTAPAPPPRAPRAKAPEVQVAPPVAAAPPRDPLTRLLIAVIGVGFLVLVVLIVWLGIRTGQGSAPVAAVTPPVVAPVAAPNPTPAPSAAPSVAAPTPTTPEPVPVAPPARIELSVAHPTDAVLELDGETVTNPFVATADGKAHHLVVTADGFVTIDRQVQFDHELTMNLSLVPKPTPAGGKPPAVTGPVRRAPPPARAAARGAKPTKEDPADSVFQELPAPTKTRQTQGKNIDTDVFDDKKQEIDRSNPWDN